MAFKRSAVRSRLPPPIKKPDFISGFFIGKDNESSNRWRSGSSATWQARRKDCRACHGSGKQQNKKQPEMVVFYEVGEVFLASKVALAPRGEL